MSKYKAIFRRTHTFLAVVHVEDCDQAMRNAHIARDEGADGIFLINHHISYVSLLEIYAQVTERLPGFWVGLNCLDLGRDALAVIPKTCAGLWVDNAGVNEDAEDTMQHHLYGHADRRRVRGWSELYFGGVAFKYQEPVRDYARVAKLALPFVDVITTSGAGTGIAADTNKVRIMKNAIGDHPLAIASGITPENIPEYLPFADCFLVATGISDSHTELNPRKVRALVKALGR